MTTVVSSSTDRDAIHDAFQSDGYVLVKGLISPEEAGGMRQEVHELFQQVLTGRNGAWGSAREVAGAEDKQELQGCTTCSSILRSSAGCSWTSAVCRRRRGRALCGESAVASHQGVCKTLGKRCTVPVAPGLPLLPSYAAPGRRLYLPSGRCPGGKRVRDGDPAEPQPRTTGAHRGG